MTRYITLASVLLLAVVPMSQASTATVSFASTNLSSITDKQTTSPFSGVSVTDTDSIDFNPVQISFPTSHGTLTVGSPYNVTLSNGVYWLSRSGMDAAQAESGLQDIVFHPVSNRIPMGTVETNAFTVTVTDASNSTDSATVYLPVVPANDSPTITLPSSVPGTNDTATALPFASITINDVDSNDTVTVEVTFPAVRGTLSTNANFVKTLAGATAVYTLSARSPDSAETFMKTVVFTPTANRIPIGSTESTIFTTKVTDAASAQASDTVSITITPVNDPPLFTGSIKTPVNDNVVTNLFTGFTITDVDNSGTQRVVVTASIGGSGESGVATFTNSAGLFPSVSYTNTPALVTTFLQGLLFAPVPNRQPVGSNETVEVMVDVEDIDGLSSPSNRTYTVTVVSINDDPSIVPRLTSPIADNVDSQPFDATVTDDDFMDEQALSVSVAFTNPADVAVGSFSPTNAFSGTRDYVESAIRGITFVPVRNSVSGNKTLVFRFTAADAHGGQGSALASLVIQGQNDTPDITGIAPSLLRMTDDPNELPIRPFATVQISDPDQGQTVRVNLSVDDPAKGVFSLTSLTGTPDVVTTALRAVTFAALRRPNRVVGETVNATLTITVTDSASATRANSGTIVAITSVNGAPQIRGVPVSQPLLVPPTPPVRPFAGVYVVDDETNNVTVKVSLDDPAKGSLTNLNGFVPTVPGSYQIVTNYEAASVALSNLAFVVSDTYAFPPNAPGGTVFTIQALDSVLNLATKTLSIILQYEPRNVLVTHTMDDSLPGSLRYAVAHCENNGFITFALPEYPALIQLNPARGPVELVHNVNFRGPGADRLTISGDANGDGLPEVQLFRIFAAVTMEGMTLSRGRSADTGGACYVGPNGALTMRYCAVRDSLASQWGGAIDVEEGALSLENCLLEGNRTSETLGLGGGGISLYTDENCSFVNTTFAGNRQQSGSGIAGGALYVENLTPSTALQVLVRHCTFAGNIDAADASSAIMSLGFGSIVTVHNSIFMDEGNRSLGVDAAGEILSVGGNLASDSTRTVLIQEGVPEEVILLNATNDLVSVPIETVLALPLATNLRPTTGYPLQAGSPAIGRAVAPVAAIDQLGVIRDAMPDSGALEYNRTARIVLNEIQFDPAAGQPGWLEWYVPRDSAPVDLNGLVLCINGVTNHSFTAPLIIQPGHGLVMADTNGTMVLTPTNNPIPVVHPGLAPLNLASAGTIELLDPVKGTLPVVAVTYLGVFADASNPTQVMSAVHNSITLVPQFGGAAYVPHSLVLSPPLGGVDMGRSTGVNQSSPGSDTSPMAFGSINATPQAQADSFVVGEDDLSILDVLGNDMDADGLDRLVIFDVSPSPMSPADRAITNSMQGAAISLDPANVPDPGASPLLRGSVIFYDPRHNAAIQALPEGTKITDSFCYTIVDVGTGPIEGYAATGLATVVTSPGHRLTNNEEIVISGCDITNYNGMWNVTRLGDDTFSIPAAYVGAPATNGSWVTRNQRQQTSPSQGSVIVEVLGANDYPVPGMDTIPADEDTVLRIMADVTLVGATGLVFETDAGFSNRPPLSAVSLLANDTDPDTDDNASTLNLVGVLGMIHPVTDYTGTPGASPVTVHSPGHGLVEGTVVLISGYGGHPSYNGYHAVSVVDTDTFTIAVRYVDNAAVKGCWGLLTDTGRLHATSAKGAIVQLDLRALRAETSVLYDPTSSSVLNALAVGETGTDTFYYAVADRHGAVSIGEVQMLVAGRNDGPTAQSDPGALGPLSGWPGGGSLPDLLPQLTIDYALMAASAKTNRADVRVQSGTNGTPWVAMLRDVWITDEDTPLMIPSSELLVNDSDVDLSDQLVVQTLPASSHEGAALVLGSNALVVTYNPTVSSNLDALARNEYRLDDFNVVVSDQHGGSATSLVAVLVVGRDDSPVARNDNVTAWENQMLIVGAVGVLTNDTEFDINGMVPDNRKVLVDRANRPTLLPDVWSQVISNTIVYNPTNSAFLEGLAAGQTIEDEVPYTMMDGSFVFANPDWLSVMAGASNVVLDVLSNDRTFTGLGGSLRIVAVGVPSESGQFSIGAGGSNLVYSPAAAFVGDEVVTYEIDDGLGNTDRAQVVVRVTVNRLNGLLQANDDSFAVARGESVVLDVLANDNVLPETGTNLVVTAIVSIPDSGGQAVIEGSGITYTPDSGYVGAYPYSEQFRYAVSGGGSSLATATVTVLVVNRQGTLEVRDDSFSVNAGSLGASLDVLLNDDILPGLPVVLSVESAGPAVYGDVVIDGDGRGVTYVPPAGFIGVDTFSYVATDGVGGTGTGTVTVSVGVLTVCDDTFVVTNMASQVELGVLANDGVLQSVFGNNLIIESVAPTNTALGLMSVKSGGKRLLFGPATQLGEQTYVYTVTDGAGRRLAANAHILVMTNGIEASPDVFAVLPDSIGNVLDVLRNDVTLPAQGRTLSVLSIGTGVDAPNQGGTVTVAADGYSLIYTPAAGFHGEETFTYTMTDSVRTDTAKVVVKVPRGELIANPDRYSVFLEMPAGGADSREFILPVTVNDIILPDLGEALSIVSLGNGSNAPDHQGTVVIGSNNQTVVYRPYCTNVTAGYEERFTYEISDGTERRAQGVVWVRVLNRTNAVAAATCDDVFAVERNSTNNTLTVLANDGIKPGLTTGWSITGVSASSAGGTVAIVGGVLRYSPPVGFVGLDHLAYQVTDGFGGTGDADVTVRVGGLTLNQDVFTAISGSRSNVLDVLVNDPVQPGTTVNYHLVEAWAATAGGTVSVDGGRILYSPLSGYSGPWPYAEEFAYRVMDDTGTLSTGHVTMIVYREGADRSNAVMRVTVTGVNDPPVITGTVAGQRYYLEGIKPFPGATISDVDNFGSELQTVTVTLLNPTHGTLTSLGAFTTVSNGTIRLSGVTPLQASMALHQLVFSPSMDPAGAGHGRVTRLSIATFDGTITVTDTNTTLIDSPAVEARVLAGNVVSNGLFGSGVAVSSNLVVAGMASDISNAASYVSASFLVPGQAGNGAWLTAGKVMSTNTQTLGNSGVSVALEGDTLVVGAPKVLNGAIRSGAVYVYYRNQGGSNQWGLVRKLIASDGAADDEFGNFVAISGDTIAVGALRDMVTSVQNGSVYLFSRNQGGSNQWGQIKKLTLADAVAEDVFGCSVALVGDTLAVGAPQRDDKGYNSGTVYIYMRDVGGSNQWGQVLKKNAADAAVSNEFGFVVAMKGDILAVGAPYESQNDTNSGAVYLFSRHQGGTNQWGQIKKIKPSDIAIRKEYGWSVSLDDSWLAVGAKNDPVNGVRTGSAYLYARNYPGVEPWGFVQKFTPNAGSTNDDQYGYTIAVGGGVLAVGARNYSVPQYHCGATYVYRFKYNNPPEIANPVSTQMAEINEPFGLILPSNTFADPDVDDVLTLSADYSLSPGLASWLTFDPVNGVFSGIPGVAGTNTVGVRAVDRSGASVTNYFALVVVTNADIGGGCTPFALWKDRFFGVTILADPSVETLLWGNQADPDGDGIPNLIEYVFGMNPRIADSADAARLTLAPLDGASGYATISFRRRSQDWYLTYTLEISSDLVTWQPAGARVLDEDITPLLPGVDLVTQMVLLPVGVDGKQFYRVSVAVAE